MCGGAAGLALAADLCRANPEKRVLLLALECCSLTFRRDDVSIKNLVGTALFGDGAAAVLVAGDAISATGPKTVATKSKLFPDSERIMGWDIDDKGMRLVLSPLLPGLIEAELASLIDGFLAQHQLTSKDIRHYLLHPGGARVIAACKKALELEGAEMYLSEESLRHHGNVSSVSVLMILEDWLAAKPEQQPGYGVLAAFGPGFSAEMLLLEV
jgi:alkylresorcinol/alkylpyrone synthase